MYEKTQAPRTPKRDTKLRICVAAAVILLLLAFIPIPWAYHQQYEFNSYKAALNDSIFYAQKHGGMWVELEGQRYHSHDSGSGVHLYLLQGGLGRRQRTAPQEQCSAMMDFGDGSVLRLWQQEVYDGYNGEWVDGIFVEYRYPDGTLYMYDSDQMNWTHMSLAIPQPE